MSQSGIGSFSGLAASMRFDAVREVMNRIPRKFDPARDENGRRLRTSEYYGMNTFNAAQMRQRLSKEILLKFEEAVKLGKPLDRQVADAVATAVRDWAIERGVSHFCHWFQPQTGATAEKHDAFLAFDDHGRPVEKFTGAMLIQSEPDASSFPSGGMRTTFEARGYTAWDPSTPMFIMETASNKTLCIPSVFISYHGDALDEKTGLIRSIEVLSQKTVELLNLIGETQVKRVVPTLGVEQEYFLIDRAFWSQRQDLIMAGRTLLGGQPPKGQQLEDHYFGSIPSRVQSFMGEFEHELYKLGVPVKTRHNEVAPSQFETAPIFEDADIATDHNQIVMEVLRKVSQRHHFAALLHEKPFAGVNGSGKHCNWSMRIASASPDMEGENLLEPGKTPHKNLRFLLILAAVMKGVHKHGGMLRAGIASSGNDHRLGANEAPPAIISIFLGELLTRICDALELGAGKDLNAEQAVIELGVGNLPLVMRDNTDRNRTSPFAFTGNKFEFRAVGSSASPAFPMTLLNAAVADGISLITGALKKKLQTSKDGADQAILEVVRETIRDTRAIRFEGNGYSEEWVREASLRSLPNLRKTPEALFQLKEASTIETVTRLGIFTEAELNSRYHVRLERYLKNMAIEVDTLKNMVDTQILPACFLYLSQLSSGVASAKLAGLNAPQAEVLVPLSDRVSRVVTLRTDLDQAVQLVEAASSEERKAEVFANEVSSKMAALRAAVDEVEGQVSDELWPLPKYREMLFMS
jgi:glutamine synthetase